jgi:hypothetical protein
MMMKGPLRDFVPVGEQEVQLCLQDSQKPRHVHLLAAGKTIPTKRSGGFLVAKVPSILDHEVLAIDL